jgi:hypothetical protein
VIKVNLFPKKMEKFDMHAIILDFICEARQLNVIFRKFHTK